MNRKRLRRDKLTRRQQWELEERRARSWQRRVMRTTRAQAVIDTESKPLAYYRRNGRHKADTDHGAVLVEYALILPLAVLLSVTGLFYGLATLETYQLQAAVTEAVKLVEDEAAHLVESAGGTLVCYWSGEGAGGCYDDGITARRLQIVAEGKTWRPPIGSPVTVHAEAVTITGGAP